MPVVIGMLIGLFALSGCISLGRGEREGVSHHAVRKELAEFVKSYRLCLQKYEDYPGKAKEICTVYREAIHEFIPSSDRRSIVEMLERLLERGDRR